jgi:UDP-glucose 4-epimerase
MTRLLLPLAEAVELVTFAIEHGKQGDIFVRKAVAATVGDLAQAMLNLFQTNNEVSIVGIRAGEKMHEVLVTAEEFARAQEFEDYYCIECTRGRDYDRYFSRGICHSAYAREGYTSENARRLTVSEIEELLLRLPEIRDELAHWSGRQTGMRSAA